MSHILFSTVLIASFLGGTVALLAPCCVSVMLPAYFATTLRRRTGLVGMTLVFASGVAVLIIPIALGASAIGAAVSGHHALVFSVGGLLMVVGGLAVLGGWKPALPMLGMRTAGAGGVGSVFALGLFSGAASVCCAPVLAGVVVLSGATGSFLSALAIAVTYVFGMVVPLFLLALLWDRRDWGSSRLLSTRTVTARLGNRAWSRPLATLASGVLLVAMGLLSIVLAVTGPSMPTHGWQVSLSAWLQHATAVLTRHLGWVPGWVFGLLVLLALVVLIRSGVRQLRRSPTSEHPSDAGAAGGENVEPTVSAHQQ